MKFDMSVTEFESFCSALKEGGQSTRVQELETRLAEAHADLDTAIEERVSAYRRLDSANADITALINLRDATLRDINELRQEVQTLRDKLVPYRVEKAYSRAFDFHLIGKKIFAIKEIRAILNIGLRDAKDVVEGNYADTAEPNLVTLSDIFANLGMLNNSVNQRGRLLQLVSVIDPYQLDSILAGKFHLDNDNE